MTAKQGDLDSLCGVYSVVNAFSILLNLDKKGRESLFKHLIAVLEDEERTVGAITGGTTKWEIELLVLAAIDYSMIIHNKKVGLLHLFKSGKGVTIETFWTKLEAFFKTHETCSVIVGMVGRYDHWTCVKKMTPKTMIVDDSVGVRHIRKSKCKMDKNYVENLFNFTATQTWGLYLI